MTHLSSQGRDVWRRERLRLEDRLCRQDRRSTPLGERRRWSRGGDRLFNTLVTGAVHLAGLHGHGRRNAADLRVRDVPMAFAHLPPAFDGYGILHLSDLHVGNLPELSAAWVRSLSGTGADLVAITGDFQSDGQPAAAAEAGRLLAPLLSVLAPRDGIVAVLGNHDRADMADVLGAMGVTVLVNERHTLNRRGEHIHLVGTDDVHCFYTPAATAALSACRDGFRIALVHSPELAGQAEAAGYALYLCGHTHGGQIALPGGRPLLTMLDRHRDLAAGAWRHGHLRGHTSAGTGTGDPPLRFNTRPEATLIRLVRG